MTAVLIVLSVVIFLIGIPLLSATVYLCWQLRKLIPVFEKLAATDMAAVAVLPATVEKYQEGVIKIGEAQVESITKLETAIDRFADMMFGGKPGDGLTEYDEGKANRAFEEEELVRRGIPREEARERVAERHIYDSMRLQR